MTDRHTVDSLTSDALDALYYRLDRARDAAALHRQGLLTTAELYAVIEAAPAPTQPRDTARHAARSTEDQMTDQPRKRITIDAPTGSTILAARHLDATEGRVQIGSTVDTSTRSAITQVLRYISTAHNSPTAPDLEEQLDAAYRERAHLVALLATLYPTVIAPALDVDEPGWWIAYLTIGGRQASWHISPRDAGLFAHVERVDPDDPRARWDGHTTEAKYEWLRELTALRAVPGPAATAATKPACGSGCAEGHTYGFRCEQQGGPTTTEATERAAPFSYEERERTGRNAGLVIPTNPAEHCGHRMPGWVTPPRSECVLRPDHTGSHADDRGARWWYDPEDIDWRQRADQLAATLREVLDTFTTARRDDGVIAGHLLEGAIHPDDMNRWRAALDQPQEQPHV